MGNDNGNSKLQKLHKVSLAIGYSLGLITMMILNVFMKLNSETKDFYNYEKEITQNTPDLRATFSHMSRYNGIFGMEKLFEIESNCSITNADSLILPLKYAKGNIFSPNTHDAETMIDSFVKQLGKIYSSRKTDYIAIDVGANVGQFSSFLIDEGFYKIYSFEPFPATCEKFRTNMKDAIASEQLKLYCGAVGNTTENLYIQSDKSGSSASNHIAESGDGEDVIEVPTYTLDDIFYYGNDVNNITPSKKIALLKTDTQGFEMQVLQGARKLLETKRVEYVVIETSWLLLDAHGSSPKKIADHMLSLGYYCCNAPYILQFKDGHTKYVEPEESWNNNCKTTEEYYRQIFHSWTDIVCFLPELELKL